MNWTKETLAGAIYKRLYQRLNGETVAELARLYEVPEENVLSSLETLEERRLVMIEGQLAQSRRWRDQPHLLVRLEIPRVAQSVFAAYQHELDNLCDRLERDGIETLRPPTGEVEIVVAATTFAGGVLARSVLTKVGDHLAAFVGSIVSRLRSEGVTSITLTGHVMTDDRSKVSFSISGPDARSVAEGFHQLRESLRSSKK